ncbi:hypothetical protein GCM10027589_03870 [Actinocorallia lasiicapitis]
MRGTAALAAIVMLGAGAVGGFLVRGSDPPDGLPQAAEAESAPVTTEKFSDERSVKLAMSVAPPSPLTVTARGRVTSTKCAPRRPIRSGSVVARINEAPLVALATTVPLYRDLTSRDRGRDVLGLQYELRRLGHSTGLDGVFGTATRAAVKALFKESGDPKADGSLKLAQVLWLPAPRVTPDKCSLVLGGQVNAGTEIATIPKRLSGLRIRPLPSYPAPGRRTLRVFGIAGPVAADGTVTSRTFLAKISASREFRDVKSADEELSGTYTLARAVTAVKIPPSAVFGIDGNKGCVQSGGRRIPVQIVGSKLGTSLVTLKGAPPAAVDLGPALTAETCDG